MLESPSELDGHEGVEAEVEEALAGIERGGIGMAQDGSRLQEHEGDKVPLSLALGEAPDPGEELGLLGRRRRCFGPVLEGALGVG
jgi:hypothetical protein